jgi:hypothetical protein
VRTSATAVTLGTAEVTVTGTTIGAADDGPDATCACTSSSGNVWYRFTLPHAGVVYIDSQGSVADTGIFITDSTGSLVPAQAGNGRTAAGLCNDDAGCGTTSGFDSTDSRTWGFLAAGTYYVSVSNCLADGAFTLHFQYVRRDVGTFFYDARFTGDTTLTDVLISGSVTTPGCTIGPSGEDVRWFITCGSPQLFSVCPGDGGQWQREETGGTTTYDSAMYVRSAQTGGQVACNDDGGAGIECRGYTGPAPGTLTGPNYGSRLDIAAAPRGLNTLFVDERLVMSGGMNYTLRYTVRD